MGACLDQIRNAAVTLLAEGNAVSDNPLVFADDCDILSGGNFHAEPVAMTADNLALAIAEIGALSERRTALLIDTNLSKLPPFLVEKGGLNSGFMIAQVTAAAHYRRKQIPCPWGFGDEPTDIRKPGRPRSQWPLLPAAG